MDSQNLEESYFSAYGLIKDLLSTHGNSLEGNDLDILKSFENYYIRNRIFTVKQMTYLNNIAMKYSPDNAEFKKNFTDEMRERFKLAIEYYRSSGHYFMDTIRKYDIDQHFIPSRRQYERMCENKYFIRAMKNYKAKPRYSIGDMICVRKMYSPRGEECIGLVANISDKPSFRAGNIIYDIMWISGNHYTNKVREHDIKIYREPKEKQKDAKAIKV